MSKSRIESLDLLKVVAIFGVVFLHAAQENQSSSWQIASLLCRFGVPCFLMVAGFFFYQAYQANRPNLLKQKIGRLLLPFFFWALFYAILPGQSIHENFKIILHHPISFLMTGNTYHLWFLSALAQSLFLLWLSLRFANLACGLAFGFFLFCLNLSLIAYAPITGTQGFLHNYLYVKMVNEFCAAVLFVMLGAYLAAELEPVKPVLGIGLIFGGIFITLTEALYLHQHFAEAISQNNFLGILPYALGIFLLCLAYPRIGKAAYVAKLGIYTLGIYTIHPCILVGLKACHHDFGVIPNTLIAFSGSLAVTYLLAQLKGIRRLVA